MSDSVSSIGNFVIVDSSSITNYPPMTNNREMVVACRSEETTVEQPMPEDGVEVEQPVARPFGPRMEKTNGPLRLDHGKPLVVVAEESVGQYEPPRFALHLRLKLFKQTAKKSVWLLPPPPMDPLREIIILGSDSE